MSTLNPYNVLGVASNATANVIKKAYLKEAKKTHPDKGGNTEAFKKVGQAYDILSDPAKKAAYNAMPMASVNAIQRAAANAEQKAAAEKREAMQAAANARSNTVLSKAREEMDAAAAWVPNAERAKLLANLEAAEMEFKSAEAAKADKESLWSRFAFSNHEKHAQSIINAQNRFVKAKNALDKALTATSAYNATHTARRGGNKQRKIMHSRRASKSTRRNNRR